MSPALVPPPRNKHRYTEESEAGGGITSPYGQTKFMIEPILRDLTNVKDSAWKVARWEAARYREKAFLLSL